MTVSNTQRLITYNGNGVTTRFAYPFRIFLDSDLVVGLTNAAGAETILTLGTHYIVTDAGAVDGGTVSMVTPPATGTILTIRRELPLTQETDYSEGDSFPAEAHEAALDRLIMIAQQLDARIMGNDGDFTINATEGDNIAPALTAANWTIDGDGWKCSTSPNRLEKYVDGGGYLYTTSSFTVTPGNVYKFTFTVSGFSGDYLGFYIIGYFSQDIKANGTYVFYTPAYDNICSFFGSDNARGSITSLTVQPVTEGVLTVEGSLRLCSPIQDNNGVPIACFLDGFANFYDSQIQCGQFQTLNPTTQNGLFISCDDANNARIQGWNFNYASAYGLQFGVMDSGGNPQWPMTLTSDGKLGIGVTPNHSPVAVAGLATYADNTAALAGGLVAGDFYCTSTGVLMVTY